MTSSSMIYSTKRWVNVLMDASIAALPNPYATGERYFNSSPRPGEPLGWVFNGKEWTPFGEPRK